MESMNMADNKSREEIGITRDGGESFVMSNEGVRAKGGVLTVKVDVDIAAALTGLKALQREAKEATKLLRELEGAPDWKSSYDSYRSFKHVAKYLTILMQNGEKIQVGLGIPTGEERVVYVKGHEGIERIYQSDEI
jgi:hypothetical protein